MQPDEYVPAHLEAQKVPMKVLFAQPSSAAVSVLQHQVFLTDADIARYFPTQP